MIENLERRRLLAFALNVNFQPTGSTVPSGYLADTGAVYASRGNGFTYGWNASASSFTRDRNSPISPDQRYDTLIHTQLYGTRTWEVAVPNGTYSVHIVAGDPDYTDSTIRFNAENTLVASGSLSSASHFVDGTKVVTVSDGKLTISNAAGASNNKLCFVQITSVASGSSSGIVSIAATDANASEVGPDTGTLTISRTGSTTASLTVDYAISGSATNGVDYDSLSGSVTIPAGATFADVTIKPHTDGIVEGNETVTLTLQAPSNFTLGISSASVTIADADSQPASGAWPTTWTTGANMNTARWESASVAMDGKIWVFGGWLDNGRTGTQQYEVYDVAKNTWTKLGYMPVAHTHSELAADPANHVIYLAGGLYGSYPGTTVNTVYEYNTLNNTWTSLPSMPSVHAAGALSLVNNTLDYFGGIGVDHNVDIGTHIVLDLNNLAAGWQSAPDMPDPRDHFAHVVLDGKIYAIGGEFGHDLLHEQQTLVDCYDPIAKTWTRLASIPQAKSHDESGTFVTPDGKIISAGGQIDDFHETDNVVEYDPDTNTWTTIGKLPLPMQGAVVQQVGNQIIVAGSYVGIGPVPTTGIGELQT